MLFDLLGLYSYYSHRILTLTAQVLVAPLIPRVGLGAMLPPRLRRAAEGPSSVARRKRVTCPCMADRCGGFLTLGAMGICWDNGKENGNYHLGFRVC